MCEVYIGEKTFQKCKRLEIYKTLSNRINKTRTKLLFLTRRTCKFQQLKRYEISEIDYYSLLRLEHL